MKRQSRIVALGLSLAAFALSAAFVACQLAFPTVAANESAPDAAPAPQDAAPDLPVVESAAASLDAGCGMSPPPAPTTSATLGPNQIVAAVQSVYYGQDAGPIPNLGFDLDCVDTCPGPPSCNNAAQRNCDLSDGRDLAANLFVETVETFEATTAQGDINHLINAGKVGFLIWLSGYNGEANDSMVVVSTITSTGIVSDPEAGVRSPPKWDGNDEWSVDPNSVVGQPVVNSSGYHYTPMVIATSAYVTNYTLVASVSGIPVNLGVGILTLSHAYLVAKITALPGVGYRLDGQLAGRMTTRSILGLLASFNDPLDHTQYLCGTDPTFLAFRTSFCGSADIMFDPAADKTDASCDALSLGLGFVALSAKLGAEYPQDTFVVGCDGGIQDCER